jgi:hypothetical protein
LTNQNSFQLALAKSPVREPAKQPPAGTFAADEGSTLSTPPASMELADKEKASKSIDRGANASALRELEAAKAGSGGEERQKLEQPAPAATIGGALALGTPTNNFKAGGEFGVAANLPAAAPPPAASPELTLNDRLMTTQQLAYRNTSTQTITVQVARRDSVVVSQVTTGAWQNAFPNAPASRPAAAVLANFQVQQNGTTLRVVDADGSVYAGTLLPASNNVQIASIQAAGKTLAKDSPQQTAPTISFQVTGINQALQQKVVFTGNIEPMPVTVENAQSALHNENAGTAGTQIQQNNANLQPQTWLSNTRIVGTAIIDPTNQIQIIAVPASP